MSVLIDPQQENACQIYASGLKTQEQAYQEAGYAEANNAARFFGTPKIRSRVAEIKRRAALLAELDVGWVLHQLKALAKNAAVIGEANLDDYFSHNPEGQRVGIDLAEVSRRKMAALDEVTVEQYVEGPKDDPETIKRTRIKLRSAGSTIQALELIGKHLGMWRDKLALTDADGDSPAKIIHEVAWKADAPAEG